MRTVWYQIAAVLVIGVPLAMAQQSTATQGALAFENGTVDEEVYSNECLGFSFSIPTDWKTCFTTTKARHVPGGLALLTLCPKNANSRGTIALQASDATNRIASAQDYVSGDIQRIINKRNEDWELIASPYPVAYGGRLFSRAQYRLGTSYYALVYTKFRQFFIGELVVGASSQEVDQAVDSLLGVSFKADKVNPKCLMTQPSTPVSERTADGIGILSREPAVPIPAPIPPQSKH